MSLSGLGKFIADIDPQWRNTKGSKANNNYHYYIMQINRGEKKKKK